MVTENIEIGLDSADFISGVEDMKKKLKGFENSVEKTIEGVGKSLKKITGLFLGLGAVGAKVLKVLNIEQYKKFRNYIVALGVSTAKTTGVFSKFLKTGLALLPLWAKWVLGIGGVVLAYNTLRWAVIKFRESLLDLNEVIEDKTQLLLLMHKGAIIDLTQEYKKRVIELSNSQARMIVDYDKAVTHLKQTSEALTLWWDLNSPFKRIARSIVITTADISKAIQHFVAEIPKTAEKVKGLELLFIESLSPALRKELTNMVETIKNVDRAFIESDPIWQTIFMNNRIEAEKSEKSIKQFAAEMWRLKQASIEIAKAEKERINLLLIQQDIISTAINKYGSLIEFFSLLRSEFEGQIDNVDDLKVSLDNLGLSLEDLLLVGTAMRGITMTDDQNIRLSVLLQRIRDIVTAAKEGRGIPIIELDEGVTTRVEDKGPVGPPELLKEDDTGLENAEAITIAAVNLVAAATALDTASDNLSEASTEAKASALAASIAMVFGALATAQAAGAFALATFNFAAFAASLGAIASIVGLIATISSFDVGGFVSAGPGSLPDIPQARDGMITPPNVPSSGMLVNVHGDEGIFPLAYLKELFGSLAASFFKTGTVPTGGGIGLDGGGTTIIINANGAFDSPSYWTNLFRTKIRPAMAEVNYGRLP